MRKDEVEEKTPKKVKGTDCTAQVRSMKGGQSHQRSIPGDTLKDTSKKETPPEEKDLRLRR